jgi:hypothetical protein
MVPLIFLALSLLAIVAEAQSNPAKAREYIRVIQEDGVWWFQEGSGHRFLSLGVNCVGGCYGHAEETPIHPARKARILSALRDFGYRQCVLQAARAPFMVGMHWFMWLDYAKQDQAIRGFPPDENVGLVSNDEAVTYEELGRWVKGTHGEIDAAHRGARWVAPPHQRPQSRPLKRFTPTVDGDVSEWPKELALKPALVTALTDGMKVDHTYFMSWDTRYMYLAGDIRDSRLDHPGKDQAWQGDYLCVQFRPAKAADRRTGASSTICIYPQG